MPEAPLPSELDRWAREARPAVVSTLRGDGAPVTTATWYDWEGERVLLSMDVDGARARRVSRDPRVALTILGSSWYDHVSITGLVVELRDDAGLADLDRLAQRYWGKAYPKRELRCVTALVEVQRWHAWGRPRKRAGA